MQANPTVVFRFLRPSGSPAPEPSTTMIDAPASSVMRGDGADKGLKRRICENFRQQRQAHQRDQ